MPLHSRYIVVLTFENFFCVAGRQCPGGGRGCHQTATKALFFQKKKRSYFSLIKSVPSACAVYQALHTDLWEFSFLFILFDRHSCTTVRKTAAKSAVRLLPRPDAGQVFWKVLHTVTLLVTLLYCKYTRVLTFQSFCQARGWWSVAFFQGRPRAPRGCGDLFFYFFIIRCFSQRLTSRSSRLGCV